jgi:methionine biosynthesis protein MetW
MTAPTVPLPLRSDQQIIANLIPAGVRLLDVGCGQGVLLHHLRTQKQVDARGLEISQHGVNECVRKGLAVIQGDADEDLKDYPDNAFNWVVLSQTLQATKQPRVVLEQMARIGERLVVSIPNFGYWRVRLQFILRGRMPVNKHLSYQWYDTPNIHFCTITDFIVLAEEIGLEILNATFLQAGENEGMGKTGVLQKLLCKLCPNIFAEQVIFTLKKSEICVY